MNITIKIDYKDERPSSEISAVGPENESSSLLHNVYEAAANALDLEPFWRQYIKKEA